MRSSCSTIKCRLLFVGICYAFFPSAMAARILIIPVVSPSHAEYFAHVSDALLDRGHEVYGIVNADCKKTIKPLEDVGVKILPYYHPKNDCYVEERLDIILGETLFIGNTNLFQIMSKEFVEDAEIMLSDDSYFQNLKSLNFDLCIVDGMGITLYTYIIPYKLDVPHVTLTTSFFGIWANVPLLPSFSPYLYESVSDRMTFFERVRNTINMIKGPIELAMHPGSKNSLISKYAPDRPSVSFLTLQRRSKLWLINTDPVLDYPRVSLPHVIHVGGLTTRERQPLPDDLNKLVKKSKNTVIVSFGSMIDHLPRDVILNMTEAFRQIEDVIFIFKYKGPTIEDVPKNVHLVQWFPQNDLLGQPSVRLFITHCGNNGQFEAMYHAVPMIGLPVYGDQYYGCKRMEVKGFGIVMNAFNFSVEDMVLNINKILNDESYEIAIDRASQVFLDQYDTPKERAAYWIDHVIKFGADHLMSSAVEMPWYQYWLIDVLALFFSILFVFGMIVFLFVYGIIRSVNNTTKVKKD